MKRHLLCILLLALLPMVVAAQAVGPEAASLRARDFLRTHSKLRAAEVPMLVEQTAAAYVFRGGSGDFVVIAADERLPEVLGYGSAAQGERPQALLDVLRSYERRLKTLPPLFRMQHRAEKVSPVSPLLTTIRHQEAPYNAQCPYYWTNDTTRSEERCIVGCVATALEQILTYHRRDYVLCDTLHGWTTDHYTIPDVMPGVHVDSRLILDNYDNAPATQEELDAVARLSYWMGMVAHMSWGLGASAASTHRCVEPLQRAFGMGYVHYADSYKYAPEDWHSMLRAELQAGRPLYYSANTMRLNGHAFVIDGCDEDGFYHVNWGYGGHYDGYFDLTTLYSTEPIYDRTEYAYENGFISNHEAIFLHPDAISPALPDTLTRTGEELQVVSWERLEQPMTVAYPPMMLTVQNTSDQRLTTPIELFTNLPTDTAMIYQGDYIALVSATLDPGEVRELTVHLRFDEGGDRILRLSTDDVHYQTLGNVSIAGYHMPEMTFENLTLSFPDDDNRTASFTLDISNAEGAGRVGRIVGYELGTPDDGAEYGIAAHAHYIYMQPGESLHDSISFRCLEYGKDYELRVRCPWAIVKTLQFRMPVPEGIHQSSMDNSQSSMVNGQSSMAYDLQGRRVNGQCSARPNGTLDTSRMVNGQSSMVNGQWSILNGQCPKGVYIVGGKKVLR